MTIFKIKVKSLFLLTALGLSTITYAGEKNAAKEVALDHVVAVINQEVITESQVNGEVEDLQAIMTAQKAHNPQVDIPTMSEQALRDQALQRLINRSLQAQYAKKMKLQISDEVVDQTIGDIAKQNSMDMTAFSQELAKEGITLNEYRGKIRQQLIERELKQKIIVPRVQVSAAEVQQALQDPENPANQKQLFFVRDYLVEVPEGADQTTITAANEKAVRVLQMVKEGKDPEAQDAETIELGWRKPHELPDVFAQKLITMKKGESQGPVLTANGYHVLQLVDLKQSAQTQSANEYQLRHILMKPTSVFTDNLVKQQLNKIKKEIEAGAEFAKLARKYSEDFTTAAKGGELGWLRLRQLPSEFVAPVQKLKKGQVSEPFKNDEGWHLLYVEDTRALDDTQALREQETRAWIFQKKVQVESEKWLAKLKESTFIKIETA